MNKQDRLITLRNRHWGIIRTTWIIKNHQRRYLGQNKNNRRNVNSTSTSSTQPDRVDSHIKEYSPRPEVVLW